MSTNNIAVQNINNNHSSTANRVVKSAAIAAGATFLSGAVCMIEAVYPSPRLEKESYIQHVLRDLGMDVKKRYTKFFNRLGCQNISDKISNMKEAFLGRAWFGTIFTAFFLGVYILSLKDEKKANRSDNLTMN